MVFEFALPDVGEGIAEGEIVAWHVEPGDTVSEDEVIAEVETDKAVVELPSPVEGTVVERQAEVGDTVPVGGGIVTIDTTGDAKTTDTEGSAEAGTGNTDDGVEEDPTGEGGERVFAPPSVRRVARKLDVEVAAVDGSGPGGRITEADVRAAADGSGAGDETVESAIARIDSDGSEPEPTVSGVSDGATSEEVSATAGSPDRDQTLATPATRKVAREEGIDLDAVPTDKTRDGEAFVEAVDIRAHAQRSGADQGSAEQRMETDTAAAETGGGGENAAGQGATADETTREPYSGIRRTIGQQMEQSKSTAPHVSHHDTAVVPDFVDLRERLAQRATERDVTLTYLPFVLKAVVAALKEYPVFNTTLDEDSEEIVYRHYYDIGVAVATEAGLMVPVVENVDGKGILAIARETNDLAARARKRDLTGEEMQGSTFTVTNFGAIGGEYATPIINYPETAILGLGSLEQRPVVEDDAVVASDTLPLSLSFDHRVIDGAEAAQFVNTLKGYLEDPTLLLLE
jgi:pyruvate dehydrogenase E2 component (dihydrolipoamide acetyltransferase)